MSENLKMLDELKAKRDELNAEVKKAIDENRAQLDKLKSLNDNIKKLKLSRDSKNQLVKELKEKRKAVTDVLRKHRGEFREVRAEARDGDDSPRRVSAEGLKKSIEKLDWDLQTRHMSVKQDELMRKRLESMESQLSKVAEQAKLEKVSGKLLGSIKKLEEEAELTHELIIDNSQKSQVEHKQLLELYEQVKKVRETVDPISKRISELKKEADGLHTQYILARKKMKDDSEERKLKALEEKKKAKEMTEKELEKKASDLFKEFTKGKKLTSEELMIIQKYGSK